MLCLLCFKDNDDIEELYNEAGGPNEIYDLVCKYFPKEVNDRENKYPRIVCVNCSQRIREFSDFQAAIASAEEKYKKLFGLEYQDDIKLETEVEYSEIAENIFEDAFEEDPMQLTADDDNLKLEIKSESSTQIDQELEGVTKAKLKSTKCDKRDESSKEVTPQKRRSSRKRKSYKSSEASSVREAEADKKLQIIKRSQCDAFIAEHKQRLPCDLCDESFGNFAEIHRHFRETHNRQKGYVVCCQRKYSYRTHLAEHLKFHINPQHFKCSQCDKCYVSHRALTAHTKSRHTREAEERTFRCEVCGKGFATSGILRGHMDIHATGSKDHVCSHCGKGFVLESRLRIHVRNTHSEKGICDVCGKSFSSRYDLKRHVQEHEGTERRKWPCDECDAQLHSKFSLGRHKRWAHTDNSTVYVCSECGKVALNEDALKSHKKYMHQKERKFKCNICDKAFKVAVVLKEHMTTHTGEDLYQCPHCPKKFKVSANMHHHRKRVHPKEFEKTRQRRALATQADLSAMSNEIVI